MIVELALTSGIDPITIERLLKTDPRLVGTIIEVVHKKAERKAAKKRGRR